MLKQIKLQELLKFLVGGGSAVVTDYSFYYLLINIGIPITIAKLSSFILGSIIGFIINKLWTFESKNLVKIEIAKYAILYIITAYLNVKVNNFFLSIYNIKIVAFLFATGTSTVLNFLGQKFFVFRR
ncbi:MAG: Arabinogalactan biosynthesis recruiting protein [Firmicutes bacterium]|nr:Arabinogalactan biosynthesis recruiting protein [Bacillota bacterium]